MRLLSHIFAFSVHLLRIPVPPPCLVFTKCKQGLQEGVRAENLALRLWHLEQSSSFLFIPTSLLFPRLARITRHIIYLLDIFRRRKRQFVDSEEWDRDRESAMHQPMTTSKPFSPPSKSISPYRSHIGAPHQHPKQQKPLERSPSASRRSPPSPTNDDRHLRLAERIQILPAAKSWRNCFPRSWTCGRPRNQLDPLWARTSDGAKARRRCTVCPARRVYRLLLSCLCQRVSIRRQPHRRLVKRLGSQPW